MVGRTAGEHGGFRAGKKRREGKHRTEVTEGEIWGWMGRRTAGEHDGFRAGKTRRGQKHRTEVTEEENFRMAAIVRASLD
jgi:hypothetical protein